MNVRDLNQDQLNELKNNEFWKEETIINAAGLPCFFPGDIPNDYIFEKYKDTYFVNDDFCCSAGQ